MEESREAFEQWRDAHHYPKYPLDSCYWEFWEAAIQFERERLAKLAESHMIRLEIEVDGDLTYLHGFLSADEIRAGKIDD